MEQKNDSKLCEIFAKQYSLNIPASEQLYGQSIGFIEPRACYRNIYDLVFKRYQKFWSKEWHVTYGYFSAANCPCLMLRHCFILDEHNTVIDPTIMVHPRDYEELNATKYIAIKVFDTVQDYLSAILNDKYLDLHNYLKDLDEQTIQFGQKLGYYLCG